MFDSETLEASSTRTRTASGLPVPISIVHFALYLFVRFSCKLCFFVTLALVMSLVFAPNCRCPALPHSGHASINFTIISSFVFPLCFLCHLQWPSLLLLWDSTTVSCGNNLEFHVSSEEIFCERFAPRDRGTCIVGQLCRSRLNPFPRLTSISLGLEIHEGCLGTRSTRELLAVCWRVSVSVTRAGSS